MVKGDECKSYSLSNPVAIHTADREVSANRGIAKKPFGNILDVECYILPNSPSLLSLEDSAWKLILSSVGHEARARVARREGRDCGNGRCPRVRMWLQGMRVQT